MKKSQTEAASVLRRRNRNRNRIAADQSVADSANRAASAYSIPSNAASRISWSRGFGADLSASSREPFSDLPTCANQTGVTWIPMGPMESVK